MKAIRRTKIRFEKHELKFIRSRGNVRFFCWGCQTETGHLTVSQAANALAFSERTVFRLAETGQIHSTETASGKLLICAISAANFEE